MVQIFILAVRESVIIELEVQSARNVKSRLDPWKEALVVLLELKRLKRCSLIICEERVVLREVFFFVLHPVDNTVSRVWFRNRFH